jgi:hypothetical protein
MLPFPYPCASPKSRAHVKSITYKDNRVTCYMDENRVVRSFGEGQGNGQPPRKEIGNPEWGSGFPGGRSVEYGE